ncbi:MAG: hypothetical protein C4523_06310 [Myxococcales bacterium]|nr:MAG: hypothetical protein C4523_06310 [Myxococcales bacterium]
MKKRSALPTNPLDNDPMVETFYRVGKRGRATVAEAKAAKEKPQHYKVCCISLYTEDIDRLDEMVTKLKKLGYTKANKSQVIRYALAHVDVEKMPKQI